MLFNGYNQAKKVCILKTISRREWKNQPGGAGFSPRWPYCCPLPSPVSLSLFSFPSRPLHIYIIHRCICMYIRISFLPLLFLHLLSSTTVIFFFLDPFAIPSNSHSYLSHFLSSLCSFAKFFASFLLSCQILIRMSYFASRKF